MARDDVARGCFEHICAFLDATLAVTAEIELDDLGVGVEVDGLYARQVDGQTAECTFVGAEGAGYRQMVFVEY